MKTRKLISLIMTIVLTFTLAVLLSVSVFAAETDNQTTVSENTEETDVSNGGAISAKAMAAAVVVGLVGTAGAIGMAVAISKSTESMARQPEIASKINSAMMLGLVFIETAIIYALIIAILVIFVL